MTRSASHQLALPLSGETPSAPPKITPRKTKPHHRPRVDAPLAQPWIQDDLFGERPYRQRVEVRYKKRYSLEVVRDADHLVEHEMTGLEHEAYVRQRAARALVGSFEPLPGVPENRGACPSDRDALGCPYVRCRFHLWRIDGGEDGNRAGRPGLARVPRNSKGLTVRFPGDVMGDRPPTTLLPRWLDPGPIAPSCALDEIDRLGKMTNEQTGHAMARHRTLAARELRSATRHAIEAAEERGMTSTDLIGALMQMGEKPRGT